MGKKNHKKMDKIKPLVSMCTPTFNRRPFINTLIKCVELQDYPKDRLEWIIIDDGTDPIEDLIKDIDFVKIKYYKLDKKLPLGKKRNLMHEKCEGEYIVYIDDDDYYPPQRVSHAVSMLESHKSALCAGSSEIYIYFNEIDKLYQFGPYGERHATAGTFAFRKKLLENQRYQDEAALAEEKAFLNNYTIPFIQLDPKKVILVFSHEHNTFDKRKLLENPDPKYCQVSDKSLTDFVKDPEILDFYKNRIHRLIKDYPPGEPKYKPDVLEQIDIITQQREEMMKAAKEKAMNEQANAPIIINQNGQEIKLNNNQILTILNQQQEEIKRLNEELSIKNKLLEKLDLSSLSEN